jgi:gliding motility associated protien GldN
MKSIIVTNCILLSAITVQAQTAESRIYNKSELVYDINDRDDVSQTVWHNDNGDRAPVSYPYLREADVMWSRTVWRKLDMREKMNHPIYYPVEATKKRISLVQLILNALSEGSLTAYDAMNDEFSTALSWTSVRNFGSRIDTIYVPNPDPPYDVEMKLARREFDPSTVKEFRIKEVWFFDKQRSELNVRIVGICPVAENIDPLTGEVRGLSPMFWVYFPELRNILSATRVFTRFNGNMEMTYDDLFWKRLFSSYIYKVQNVYVRKSSDYTTGINSMLESEKVKDDIFNLESDLWEY